MKAASVSDFRELARRRLPNIFFEYIDGGSYAEETLRRNVADLEAIALRQLVMRDTTRLDMTVQTLGQTLRMPVGLSPVGMAGMYARRGETQAARAAAAAGVPFCLSTVGVCSIEEVAGTGTPPWFQLYMLKDRGYMRELLQRAKAVGCPVLVFTVDLADARLSLPRHSLGLLGRDAAPGRAGPGVGWGYPSRLDLGCVRARPTPHPGHG